MLPLVSIIIPVYKVEKYLNKCVGSVTSQTYKNLEILLVDDGSPDNCPEICDDCALKDSRIKVIHKENGGLSSARNAALDVMTGEYVAFVDSDDYITPDAVETLYTSLVKTNSDIATGNMWSVSEEGSTNEFYIPATEETILDGDELLSTLLQPCAPNRLYKAEIFADIRFPVGRLYEDTFVYHHILGKANRMVLTGKNTYYYLIRSDSIMHSEYDIRFTDVIFAIKDRYEWLDTAGKTNLANEARLFVYSRTAVAYAHLDKSNPEHEAKLKEISAIYDECYNILIKCKNVSLKQKIRLIILKYLPDIHTKVWGRKMPSVLG